MNKEFKLTAAGLTHAGHVKPVNEDGFVYKVENDGFCDAGVFAVADGVGGLSKGEVASSIAISNINKWWKTQFAGRDKSHVSLADSLKACMRDINLEILELSKQWDTRMATTLTVLVICEDAAIIMHIGDSRVYRLRPGVLSAGLQQLTEDHSCTIGRVVQGRVVNKSVLTQCLGYKEQIDCFFDVVPLKSGDVFLVCSDGAYKTMTTKTLERLIKMGQADMVSLCDKMVLTAMNNGETDNITVIVAKVT